MPVLIVGVGNAYRRDDGAGLEAAARLGARTGAPVVLHDGAGDATALLDAWSGAATVLLLDATRSEAPAGTIRRVEDALDGRGMLPPEQRASAHALGLADAIALGALLGRLPRRLIVIGIEGACFDHGVGLSPAVGRAVDAAVEMGRHDVARARWTRVSGAAR
jgi:hydrogenase maturation protease